MFGCSLSRAVSIVRPTVLCFGMILTSFSCANASALEQPFAIDNLNGLDEALQGSSESDLVFAFVTKLDEDDVLDDLSAEQDASMTIEDGNTLSGGDILKRFEERDTSERTSFMQDHVLAAYFQHPASGKSVELQIAQCSTLDYATGTGPFTQQVQCGKDLYSYRASAEGLDILRNDEIHFSLPLDPGHYRINGVEVDVN